MSFLTLIIVSIIITYRIGHAAIIDIDRSSESWMQLIVNLCNLCNLCDSTSATYKLVPIICRFCTVILIICKRVMHSSLVGK